MELILNAGLAILLSATLIRVIRLERALRLLRQDRVNLDQLAAMLEQSTTAAADGIERLRATAGGTGQSLQSNIETATALRDDLTWLTRRAETLAGQLEQRVRANRPPPEPPAPLTRPAPVWREAEPRASNPRPPEPPDPETLGPETRVLETRLREPRELEPVGGEDRIAGAPRVRSQAERDLLKALRLAR